MRHDFLDRYSRLQSPIHRLPAWVKLAVALGLVVAAIAVPPRWAVYLFAGEAAVLLLIAVASRIPPGYLFRRMLWLEPFVLGVALLALFRPEGWRLFVLLMVRCTLSLFAMILLSNTTPFAELLRVLRRAYVPTLLITTLALMYRYLFVLADESQRMKRARMSRTFTDHRHSAWRSMASVASQLFVRASERAERIYSAMCARGWQ